MTNTESLIQKLEALEWKRKLQTVPGAYKEGVHDAIEIVRAHSGWKDISTAPKDGTFILVMVYGECACKGVVQNVFSVCWLIDRWCTYEGEWANDEQDRPTHWMPIGEISTPPSEGDK